MIYKLGIELKNKFNEDVEEINRFTYWLSVELLREIGKDEILYDPINKIHFQSSSSLGYVYQMDIQDVELDLCKRLGKAQDFICRAAFLNDWAEVEIKQNGKVKAIKNVNELKSTWKRIKSGLANDYTGKAVDEFFEKTDKRLSDENPFMNSTSCYNIFGLLFPNIPMTHSEDWNNRREVEISDYGCELFEESTEFKETNEERGVRLYAVRGSLKPDSKSELKKFEGEIYLYNRELIPCYSTVEIIYGDGIVLSHWNFKLERY